MHTLASKRDVNVDFFLPTVQTEDTQLFEAIDKKITIFYTLKRRKHKKSKFMIRLRRLHAYS